MGYKCREVKCYKCKHVFMWMNEIETILYEYRLKENNELINIAACPKCDTRLLILPHVLEGIPEDSDKVIKTGIRGI